MGINTGAEIWLIRQAHRRAQCPLVSRITRRFCGLPVLGGFFDYHRFRSNRPINPEDEKPRDPFLPLRSEGGNCCKCEVGRGGFANAPLRERPETSPRGELNVGAGTGPQTKAVTLKVARPLGRSRLE